MCKTFFKQNKKVIQKKTLGTSLAAQWLRLCRFTAGGGGLIPGWGTKILHDVWPKEKELISKYHILRYWRLELQHMNFF